MYVNVYIIEYLVSNRCIVAFVQACLCLVLYTKCELSVCVCVCVCVLDLIRCFLLHNPHFIHSMSVPLAPYARAKGCTCAQGGLGSQLPTADHSGLVNGALTQNSINHNKQSTAIIVYLSINRH